MQESRRKEADEEHTNDALHSQQLCCDRLALIQFLDWPLCHDPIRNGRDLALREISPIWQNASGHSSIHHVRITTVRICGESRAGWYMKQLMPLELELIFRDFIAVHHCLPCKYLPVSPQ
jgi:hypothetical protein